MRTGARVFGAFALFVVVVSIVSGFITGFGEWVGFPALLLCALMALMVSFDLHQTTKSIGTMPEDHPSSDVHEGAGEVGVGVVAPYSSWPLPLAVGAALGFLALAIGHWIFVGAGILVVIGLFGWVYEFSMGQHAH